MKMKIPSSLDMISEWQTLWFSPPSLWVSNKAEANMTLLDTSLSTLWCQQRWAHLPKGCLLGNWCRTAQARHTPFKRAPRRHRLFTLIVEMTVPRVCCHHLHSDRCSFGPHWTLTREVSSLASIHSSNKYLPRIYTLCSEQPCFTTPGALFI